MNKYIPRDVKDLMCKHFLSQFEAYDALAALEGYYPPEYTYLVPKPIRPISLEQKVPQIIYDAPYEKYRLKLKVIDNSDGTVHLQYVSELVCRGRNIFDELRRPG